jgi:osmotically-inducible protein OsmY
MSTDTRPTKSDSALKQDVIDELRWESSVSESEIGVSVHDGVVTLSGAVNTYAQKIAAQQAVERVGGVRAYANALEVRLAEAHRRSDSDVALAVADALRWHVDVPDTTVKARVTQGWVTLEGTVERQHQRSAAESAVRYLTGVRGVTNAIDVRPAPAPVSTHDVTRRIKRALHRSAHLDAERIAVEVKSGTVTLRGAVRSWPERRDAEYAAWSAPGVTDVEDELTVLG